MSDTRTGPEQGDTIDAAEESRLVQDCRKGDKNAFERLIGLYQDKIYGLAFQLLRNRDDAEDLTQEVFLSFYRNARQFRGESRLGTWLYRITVNRAKNRWKYDQRRKKDRHQSLDAPIDPEEDGPSRDVPDQQADPRREAAARQSIEILRRKIAELSPEYREAIHLRFFEHLSYEEIAEALECSLGTVKSRINRARAALREAMGDRLDHI